MRGTAMNPPKERVQGAVKIFITGAAAETSKLAELGIRHAAILAMQTLDILGCC
ncbi:hypothetical protein D3C74_505210 [compost metagenome]